MQNPSPTASGTLAETPLAHLLLYIAERRQTGTLQVRWGSRAREDAAWIYLRAGRIACARLSELQHDLMEGLAPLCALDTGDYAYYKVLDLVSGRPDVLGGDIDVRALATRALRIGAREDVVDGALASLGEHLLQLKKDADLTAYGFSGSELSFVRRLERAPQSLEQLMCTPGMPGSMVRRLVYLLRATKAVAMLPAARRTTSGTVRVPAGPSADVDLQGPGSDLRRAPASLPAPLQHRWGEIAERWERIQGDNCFQMLELDPSAGTQDVHQAFADAAQRWHPDNLPPELAPLQERAREIFALMCEARDTLGNPASRLEHLTDIDAGGGTPATRHTVANALKADTCYQKAQILARREKLEEALTMVRKAIALDSSRAEYLALCAWLTHLTQDAPGTASVTVERMLRDALILDGRCERAHHYQALILKRVGQPERALQHFRAALQIDPNNLEAQRELRIADMRQQQAQRSDAQPLLKRLFSSHPPWRKAGGS